MTGPTSINYVTWILAAIGIVASLGWNLFNTLRSNSLASRLRAEQYQLNQWERVRGRIDKAVDALIDASKLIIDEAAKQDDGTVEFLNRIVVNEQDELCCSLREADLSSYCAGDDWERCASGKFHGDETSWDLVLQHIANAQSAPTRGERVVALANIRAPINEIRNVVQGRLRIQDHELDPRRQ